MTRQRRKSKIGGQFTWQLVEMKRSPAWRVLSLSGRRVLDRLEIELAQHGSKDNGALPCTYEHFVEYGLERHCIAPAIRECEALGFIEVTERGRGGNAEHRKASLYRITYKQTDDAEPTDDWRKIKTVDDAIAAKRGARKTESRCGKPTPEPVRKTHTETPKSPVRETHTTGAGKTHTTSISREGAGP